jgi:hypothetical protein
MFKRTYANVMSTLAVFLVVAGGTAFAASSLTPDSVKSKTVKDNSLKSVDLKDGKAVSTDDVIDQSLTGIDIADNSVAGTDIADNTVTGDDVDESTLAQVPDSAKLQGRNAASFLSSSVYKNESALGPGTALGDGTHVADASCNPGDVLLSGGPANINATSVMLESFPSPGGTNSWSARINKNGAADNFSVVVLCIDE